jgi:spermidine synthase
MSASPHAVNRTTAEVPLATLILVSACFLLSGVAALVYQTAWTRQFAIVFGTSELAVATVLAAYMGGLAAGAWLCERWLPRIKRPVLSYALLELGIAASALFVVPALLFGADLALQALFGGEPTPPSSDRAATTVFYLLSAFMALAIPTTFMGATLPMLARYAVAEESQIARRIGLLYTVNTAGAVGGALLTAFVLLPEFGLKGAIWAGAAINGSVFLLALALARSLAPSARDHYVAGYEDAPPADTSVAEIAAVLDPQPPPASAPMVVAPPRFTRNAWILPLMLLAGAVAFFQEVLWSRMLAHVVGSSIYAFGVMVASFLTGIALGGGIGALVGRDRDRAARALALALGGAAVAAAVAYLLLERLLPQTAGLMQQVPVAFGIHLPNTLFAGLLLLPMTLCIGMTYPLAVRVLARDASDAAPASARVYAWNTVGAIVGSLAAGFLLIPALRYEGAIRFAVIASALLAVLTAWTLLPRARGFAIALTTLLALGAVLFRPSPPDRLLVTSPLNVGGNGKVLYYDIGRSASVVMLRQDGVLALRTNGLPEALMATPGSVPQYSGEYWLSPLAVIARPQARDMLIVGFGGGVVVEAVPPSVERIDVIELEPLVIEANRVASTLRKRDPLLDPRLNIIVNDARGALSLTSRRYDAIVSQPSHPWTAGASHLYTREFMRLAHDHLTPEGVFIQWMNVNFVDESLLRSLTATLLSVFRDVRVYRPDPNTLVFMASDSALNPESQLAQTGLPLKYSPLHYARFGINNVEDVVCALVLDLPGARRFAEGAPLITDDDNRIATSSVYERGRGLNGDQTGRILAAYDPLQRPDSFIYKELRNRLRFDYMVRRDGVFVGIDRSLVDRVRMVATHLGASEEGELARAQFYRLRGERQRAVDGLRAALANYPDSSRVRYEFVRPYLGPLMRETAPPEVTAEANKLTGQAAATLAVLKLSTEEKWPEIAALDGALAGADVLDPWYPETVEIRADWRGRVSSGQRKRQLGDEAIGLVDRLVTNQPTVALFGLRIRAGMTAERPDIVIESIFHYVRSMAGQARARGPETFEATRKELDNVVGSLPEVEKMSGADAGRIAEVRAEIARLRQLFEVPK